MIDYTRISLAEVATGLEDVAREAEAKFGALDERQLNWKPDASSWSVGQCLDHLASGNDPLLAAMTSALNGPPTSIWQRLPLWPALFGRMMVRTLGPRVTRKFKTPPQSVPSASSIPRSIVQRFVDQQRAAAAWSRTVEQAAAERAIAISPFMSWVTYSVMDAFRLLVAHDWRHVEQAKRVMANPGFPK